jgi:glycosyltransferase involved in cell wall biosynthesis
MTALMSRTAVSFVLTVYNKCRYLADVLASVAAQEGDFEREVIVVDDGSTDGSRELLKSLGPRLPGFCLIVQPNQGPSIATNRALAAASMPLIKLLDGDDLLAPDALRATCSSGATHCSGAAAATSGFLSRTTLWRCVSPDDTASGSPIHRLLPHPILRKSPRIACRRTKRKSCTT